jgi:UDP-N-acetylmuramoyl-tripeptide--D-alanyl-D-alanine ligase
MLKKIVVYILTIESRLILAKYKPFIITITGSVGKTSTKDAIFSAIKNNFHYARKSYKSMNSEIGLPLTIIGAANAWKNILGWSKNIFIGFQLIIFRKEYPDCLVLEIGADHPNDIKKVSKWLKSDIVVINKISKTPVHVEFFPSAQDVFREKSYLIDTLKNNSTLILYGDDEQTLSLSQKAKETNSKVLTFGVDKPATVRGLSCEVKYVSDTSTVPLGMQFDVDMVGDKLTFNIPGIIGNTYIYPILAAIAVAKSLSISSSQTIKSLNEYEPPRGRMNIIKGKNDVTIIDDSYNSSPDAVLSSLQSLNSIRCTGAKIAILGDMMELGKFSSQEHKNIGAESVKYCNKLFVVGLRSEATANEAIRNGMNPDLVRRYRDSRELAAEISDLVKAGDIVLVKGSQSMRMERVVVVLMAEPELASQYLVRQEKEWLEKK